MICPYMTFIFGVTQFSSVMTSIFLTVERYLVIVYCMKPEVLISKKLAAICVCAAWCVAVAYNIHAVFLGSDKDKQDLLMDNRYLCTASGYRVSVSDLLREIPLSVFLGGVYILLFFFTTPLYVHMYTVVSKSSVRMGVKREGILARNLALVIITNLVLNVIPLTLAPLFSSLSILNHYYRSIKIYNSFKAYIICSLWLPVFLLCLNSCLNPVLFAFRHHLFKRQFKKTIQSFVQCFTRNRVTAIELRDRSTVIDRDTAI